MRVALVAEDYYPQLGGVPEHVHNQALQLLEWGHAVTIVTSKMAGAGPDPEFVQRVGSSRVIYANGGVARITTGWRPRRHGYYLRCRWRHRNVLHLFAGWRLSQSGSGLASGRR